MTDRVYIGDLSNHINQVVRMCGWVHVYRDQGKMVFLDIRDMSGYVQAVVLSDSAALATAKECRTEWVIEVTGLVVERPEKMRKEGIVNGGIELQLQTMTVLNKAETPAFEVSADSSAVGEEVRFANRYLDLRTERMQKNLRMRHAVMQSLRAFFNAERFTEIETPILTKSTPEGARDYVVPSRIYPGSFYALPQSPQQYKQLLMAAGMERYYQFAKCLRDEDSRGDRQPEFTQLDMELSFVSREDVMELNEKALIHIVTTQKRKYSKFHFRA